MLLRQRAKVRQSQAFAPGTTANHILHLKIFLAFTAFFTLQPFPATLATLLTFIEFLAITYTSPKAVTNVLSTIKFYHERGGHSLQIFRHLQVRLACRSLAFTMRTHIHRAPPFPVALLRPLTAAATRFGHWDLAFRALALFAFYTFARLGSLVPPSSQGFDTSRFPTMGDLLLTGGGASLRLKFSKTRQGADGGYWVPLLPSTHPPCPVACAQALVKRARHLGLPPTCPLFAGITPGGTRVSPLNQTQARGFLRGALAVLGLPPTSFSFHSFRRGGCTLAAERGATEADLALHGDWRSEAIRDYYPAASARARVAATLAGPSPTPLTHT